MEKSRDDTNSAYGKLIVLSGAGISAESGVPTFRTGTNALWRGHDINVVCNYSTWQANRKEVHNFYKELRTELPNVNPNPMHLYQARWQQDWGAHLLTQNVDDLLERAGAKPVHLHGHLTRMLCTTCSHQWEIGYRAWNFEKEYCLQKNCASMEVKPQVVFFGEKSDQYEVLRRTLNSIQPDSIVIVTGTKCDVVPFDLMLAGIRCLKIFNSIDPWGELGEERLEIFDYVLDCPASVAAPKIQQIIENRGILPLGQGETYVADKANLNHHEFITKRHIEIMCGEPVQEN